MRQLTLPLIAAASLLSTDASATQAATGMIIGTVRDAQGAVLPGAVVRVRSPALIGGPEVAITNPKGQLRFPALPPGIYDLVIEFTGFQAYRIKGLSVRPGGTIDRWRSRMSERMAPTSPVGPMSAVSIVRKSACCRTTEPYLCSCSSTVRLTNVS